MFKREDFSFNHDVPVRYADIDSRGHVNNAAYVFYFEEGRMHYLQKVLGLSMTETADTEIIILNMHCDYISPAYHGEILKVYTRMSRLGNKSMDMLYLVTDTASGRTVAKGSSVLVAYDYSTRRTMEIPDEFREKIARFEGIPLRDNAYGKQTQD